jgi:hypothetical protein
MAIILKPENVAQLVFLIRGFPAFENRIRRNAVTDCDRITAFQTYAVTNCDRISQKHISPALRFYRAGGGHAFERASQRTLSRSEHRDCVRLFNFVA